MVKARKNEDIIEQNLHISEVLKDLTNMVDSIVTQRKKLRLESPSLCIFVQDLFLRYP